MAQTLLIGLGGTGSRVVNNVVKDLNRRNIRINDGQVCCAVLDTNKNDADMITGSGTGVPVVATSKDRKIKDYVEMYDYLKPLSWCPESPLFLEKGMLDGASQLRVKSRLAFMDTLEDGTISELEQLIDEMLQLKENAKIRVMLVSSVAGGTGAGMFIQVALWLRKYFDEKKCDITIRGIFLLPDIFVKTLGDIRKSKTTQRRLYANAYAAIRELNTITKIRLGKCNDFTDRLVIDGLFDSEKNKGDGKPVFDFAFFVDATDARGASLDTQAKYEKMVAQLVYMQLYAPMKDNLYSEEDNTFLPFHASDEPLFGSCGTAKAEYPVGDVLQYCALRATKDSLTTGWKKLDDEIVAMKEEEAAQERDGIYSDKKVDPREMYMKLFDEKASKSGAEVGKDRLFVSIGHDVNNESLVNCSDGTGKVKYNDKIVDFISKLKKEKIDTLITKKGGLGAVKLSEEWAKESHTKEELRDTVDEQRNAVLLALETFDKKVNEYADEIVRSVFTFDMGEVNAANECSIYGMLTKTDVDGVKRYVHPIAARYLLYKLDSTIKRENRRLAAAKSGNRNSAIEGDGEFNFDNPETKRKKEITPIDYLNSKHWLQSDETFITYFVSQYSQFNATQYALCEKYEREALLFAVLPKLTDGLERLIANIEGFFKSLEKVVNTVNESIEANIRRNEDVSNKVLYVCASRKEKEAIYQSLSFDVTQNNNQLNESVINAVYGKLCYEKRPSGKENKKFENMSIADTFFTNVYDSHAKEIKGKYKDEIDFDIYTALCRERDIQDRETASRNSDEVEKKELLNIDINTGEVFVDNSRQNHHYEAVKKCVEKLLRLSAPFLMYNREKSKDGAMTSIEKTFWGFDPLIVKKYEDLGRILHVNTDIQKNAGYGKNELYCYNAIYGLAAECVPKFNEMNDGIYYTSYRAIVDQMVQDEKDSEGSGAALVQTPHLDKTWHEILPYISSEKQREEDAKFYHAFWLSLAYGKIKLDAHGHFQIRRAVYAGYDSFNYEYVSLRHDGKYILKTEIAKLLDVLKKDSEFMLVDAIEMENQYNEETEELSTYVGTKVFNGLNSKNADVNPINVVVRYNVGRNRNKYVTAQLIGALEAIVGKLVDSYDMVRTEEQLEEAKYRLCKRIYDSAGRSKGKAETFGAWVEKFEDLNFKGNEDSAEE